MLSNSSGKISDGMGVTYEFVNGSGAWYIDHLILSNITELQFVFGALDHTANGDLNYFGLGFPKDPVGGDFGQGEPQLNTLALLKESTVIKSASVSIKLREPGVVIFGGVDQSAYYGDIVSLPIERDAQTG